MTLEEIEFIQSCNTEFLDYYYYKDRYALDLLAWQMPEEIKVGSLKDSSLGFLLQKPLLNTILQKAGRGILYREQLCNHVTSNGFGFKLTLDEWGDLRKHRKDEWFQTSRPGYNLVVQLNFDDSHNVLFYELCQPKKKRNHPLALDHHPIQLGNYLTMAWARLDVNLEEGEVLIEEIQNDWLRKARGLLRDLENRKHESRAFQWFDAKEVQLRKYLQGVLEPYDQIWEEAMLWAVLKYVREELGIRKVYYHTFETGNKLKELEGSLPPRSLYTKLPARFGFQLTKEVPAILKKENYLKKLLRKSENLQWFMLELKN